MMVRGGVALHWLAPRLAVVGISKVQSSLTKIEEV
jgi:hypothetical protein